MYGKIGNSGENLNGTVHPGGNFPEKSNAFRGIPFFPFLLKRPKFVVPFVWITSARLHAQRKRKLCRYFVKGTTQSRSCFRCQKNTKFLTEISIQMVSAPPGGEGGWGTWVNFCWVCATVLSEPLPNYRLFCAQRLTPS